MKAKSATKGRCWKGCKPVPGKKAYSKGSCSCGMSALAPGMIEFMRGDRAIPALKKALAKGIGNAGEPVSVSEIGVSGTMVPSLRGNAKNVQRATKKFWGEDEGLGQATEAMRYNRDWAAKTIKEDRSKRAMWPRRLTREDSLPEPLRKARARSRMGLTPDGPTMIFTPPKLMSSLTPGMIEFAADNRLDANGYAPIARPKIYATPPRNAPYVSPYNSLIKPKVKGGLLARLKAATRLFEAEPCGMAALTPGMIEFAGGYALRAFALGEDNRPRNNNGQFLANETGGADPNSMQAAYGNVEAEKMARRQNLMGRLKAMMGR